jgi:hypothetical protein
MDGTITHARIAQMPRPTPEGMLDPMPEVVVRVDGGEERTLFSYYPDELSFRAAEFVGLTVDEALALRHRRDVAYLRS